MLTSLITALRTNDIEPTAKELADALWFALQIKVAPVSTKIAQSPLSESVDSPVPNIQAPKSPNSTELSEKPVKPQAFSTSFEPFESYPIVPKTHQQQIDKPINSKQKITHPLRVPAATMLPGVLSLERALRPLRRQVESRTQYQLDEAATVQRIAEQDIWLPVLKGVAERWFEVVLVLDQSASMVIWQPTIVEWCHLLQRHGAFRKVHTFTLKYKTKLVQLYAGPRPCNPHELLDSFGRRLILVVSDCMSPAWYSGTITQLLELWGQTNPVAIVQMLPQRLWTGSGLGEATRVNLRATTPGLANTQLTVDENWFADELPTGMKMPVVTLEPESLHFWSRSLMGKPHAWISGVIFEPSTHQQKMIASLQPAGEISAEQRLQRFYATASPTAQELAGYLAAAPLTLPVMRLIQQVMLPDSRQVHLAEVFLGGLIKRISPEKCNPMVMEYDFHDGIRDLLLDSILIPEAVDVLKEVSQYLEKRLGNPLDFMALLVDPTAIDGIVIDDENRPFAEIGAKVLGRLGGGYEQIAKQINKNLEDKNIDDIITNNNLKQYIKEIKWHIITSSKSGVGKTLLSLFLVTHYVNDKVIPLVIDLCGANDRLKELLSNGEISKHFKISFNDSDLIIVKVKQNCSYLLGWLSNPYKIYNYNTFFELLSSIKEYLPKIEEHFGNDLNTVIIDTNYHFGNLFSQRNYDYEIFSSWEKDRFFIWFFWGYKQIQNIYRYQDNLFDSHVRSMMEIANIVEHHMSCHISKNDSPFIHVINFKSFFSERFSFLPTFGKHYELMELRQLANLPVSPRGIGFNEMIEIMVRAMKRTQEIANKQDRTQQYFLEMLIKQLRHYRGEHRPKNLFPLYVYTYFKGLDAHFDKAVFDLSKIPELKIYHAFEQIFSSFEI
jgi:hypothetical protein